MDDINKWVEKLHKDTGIPIKSIIRTATQAIKEQTERLYPQPLTLEQLKQMEGEPVWIKQLGNDRYDYCGWAFIEFADSGNPIITYKQNKVTFSKLLSIEDYDKTWLAYAHKPVEIMEVE